MILVSVFLLQIGPLKKMTHENLVFFAEFVISFASLSLCFDTVALLQVCILSHMRFTIKEYPDPEVKPTE